MQVNTQTQGCILAIDLDAALADPALYVATRAYANTGEDFLQFFACLADFLFVVLVLVVHLKHLPVGQFKRGLKSVKSGVLAE